MKNSLARKSIISIADLSKEEIETVLHKSVEIKKHSPGEILKGAILATCFFEPSTRTRLSFEAAMHRLGGQVIGFSDHLSTSSVKGESLQDTIKVISGYADAIVIRHPMEGSARLAQEASSVPVINAGDGANQHPTQTLLDLFTIQECQGKLQGLSIAFVGDLKYGRTVHSLATACALFDMRLYFISPEQLTLPESILHELRKKGVKFSFHQSLEEVIGKVDILYMTRIQKERLITIEYDKINTHFVLTKSMLEHAKSHMRILHPLPRVGEISSEVDETPYAYYFQQAKNGLYVRQALLSLILHGAK
jgi:aspartate carbamoyltransferase catalytic subunit